MAPGLARRGAQLLQRSLTRVASPTSRTIPLRSAQDIQAVPSKQCIGTGFSVRRQLTTPAESSNKPSAPNQNTAQASIQSSRDRTISKTYDSVQEQEDDVRLPRAVQAVYMRPLKRTPKHGLPACDLQLRSYSIRNLEFFADFAMRAAYYLNLPASGPIPLPKKIKRWTVSKSPFVHKKTKETFERITLRRLIQIKDAHPEVVQIWLAYLRKHAYYGIGMKANVWEHAALDLGRTVDVDPKDMRKALDEEWSKFGRRKSADPGELVVEKLHRDFQA